MRRAYDCDIVVEGLVIGGRRNCCFELLGGPRARLVHPGHTLPILVNGERMGDEHELVDGDVIGPAAIGPVTFQLVFRWEPD